MLNLFSKPAYSLLAIFASLFSFTALFSEHALVFDLVSHFRVQYLLGFIPMLGIALAIRAWLAAALLGASIAIHALAIAPAWISPPEHTANKALPGTLRLMSANLQASNEDFKTMLRYVREIDPAVLIVPEMSHEWQRVLMQELPQYPYHSGRAQLNNFGIGIFSKYAFESQLLPIFDSDTIPSVQVQLRWNENLVTLIGTHPVPPMNTSMFQSRNRHLQSLATHVSALEGPVIVAGDLNITPWSAHFHKLLQESRLVDSRTGFGLQASWPVYFLPASIPIDHILVSEQIRVQDRRTSGALGSDHRAVWADLVIDSK